MNSSKTTQEQLVIDRINEVGYVDNFWSIDNRVSIRLGAIIHKLRAKGWVFRGCFGDDEHQKNFYYYLVLRPGETQPRLI